MTNRGFSRGVLPCAGALVSLLAAPAAAQDAPPKIDAADTAWMMAATALVLMMTIPGLALFYAGMVRKKNLLATMAQCFAATALVSLLWVAAGYSLAFTGDGALIGSFGRVMLAGMGMAWTRSIRSPRPSPKRCS